MKIFKKPFRYTALSVHPDTPLAYQAPHFTSKFFNAEQTVFGKALIFAARIFAIVPSKSFPND